MALEYQLIFITGGLQVEVLEERLEELDEWVDEIAQKTQEIELSGEHHQVIDEWVAAAAQIEVLEATISEVQEAEDAHVEYTNREQAARVIQVCVITSELPILEPPVSMN